MILIIMLCTILFYCYRTRRRGKQYDIAQNHDPTSKYTWVKSNLNYKHMYVLFINAMLLACMHVLYSRKLMRENIGKFSYLNYLREKIFDKWPPIQILNTS